MKPTAYPFSAIVGQESMKLALLLAAVDWRLGVLLRGDKGAGKTTAARGLAAFLPAPAPFINLPIGATEDRLLGGMHLEKTLQGEPTFKPGLLSEAHTGVLYIDEINLLPAHLGDALLDAAASGVNVVEREGFSVSHPAEFVLLGSMNPEEGSLRPQLLDRFALSVDVTVSLDPSERKTVVQNRIAYENNERNFCEIWQDEEQFLREQIITARLGLDAILCNEQILGEISTAICERGVRSLRADLATMRAARAYAALTGESSITSNHVVTVLPLVLAHRTRTRQDSPPPPPPSHSPQQPSPLQGDAKEALERIFVPAQMNAPALRAQQLEQHQRGTSTTSIGSASGAAVLTRRSETPVELDIRATIHSAVRERGSLQPQIADLHERVRVPKAGIRYLFVVDSSGSHAAHERMKLVKGAAVGLIERSFRQGDEVAVIVFRGTSAEVALEPTRDKQEALDGLAYLPTGGRTPLAHALHLAQRYITPSTILILLTDGRANVAHAAGDPWKESLTTAAQIQTAALVIDTEVPGLGQTFGQARELAKALRAEYLPINQLETSEDLIIALAGIPAFD